MKKLLLIAALVALPLCSAYADDPEQFGSRYSAKADWKVMRGFHLSASEELRLGSTFDFNRSLTTLGASYKVSDWLKTGLSYSAIAVGKNSGLDWRHRAALSFTESYKTGGLHFSLKEIFQATYRVKENLNTYQVPRTKFVLKTRAKVSYKPFYSRFTPYAQAELRLLLNGANWVTEDNATFTFDGYNDLYVSKLRFQAGTEYRFSLQHALEFYLFYDYVFDKDIDYSRSLGKLQSITISQYPYLGLGVGYEFSF